MNQSSATISSGLAKIGRITPLTIIMAFVLLTEAMVVIGVLGTKDSPQLILTIFSVTFPLLVAGAFFLILHQRNWVLFSPEELGPDPQKFVQAVSSRPGVVRFSADERRFLTDLEVKIEHAVQANPQIQNLLRTSVADPKDRQKAIAELGRGLTENIQQRELIQVDLSEFGGPLLAIPLSDKRTVSDLLDYLHSRCSETQPLAPCSYNALWVLQDIRTQHDLKDMGTLWARKQGAISDDRPLSDVGIVPGAILKTRRLNVRRTEGQH